VARVSNLLELFRSLAAGEVDNARQIGEFICLAEEKRGNHTAARRLRGALQHSNGASSNGGHSVGLIIPTALTRLEPLHNGLVGVELPPKVRADLAEVVLEWKRRDELVAAGVPRRTKLLLHGPPRCGKSVTARAIAAELGLPAYVARFDAIIGAFLGQTAVHLRQLFHFTELNPCLLLLDELDALGKARGNPLDVGELDRIVIALMQELEHCAPRGLVIATTNLPKNLDPALWRRFDSTFQLPEPRPIELRRFGIKTAQRHHTELSTKLLRFIERAGSYASAEKIVEAEARRRILHRGSKAAA
jgi:AAA+ superfamily predicted ATPase